ncbi:MAG: hypothetical protein A2136_05435 [Chloroflexi bacterium RBG_16_54_11]|nr:MAG: hypothetical protein A2136_05435 [Chloroflexi bacterium RBG_16_54_11]
MGVFDTASKKIHNLLEITTKGQKVKSGSLPVTLASDEDILGRLPASLGQKAMAASLAVVVASDQTTLKVDTVDAQTVLNTGQYLSVNKFAYTDVGSTASSYVAGDLIGVKLTIAAGTPASGGSGRLKSIVMVDKANASPEVLLIIFDADPSGTTFTDADTLAVVTADQPKVVAIVKISSSDWFATTPEMACKLVDIPMRAVGTRNLFAAIVSVGTYTPGLADMLSLTLGFHYDNG